MAITASVMISREENQSSCWPRSSISWSAVMAMLRAAKPMKSKRLRGGSGRSFSVSMPSSASTPIGRLMKNTQRQDRCSVR